MNGNLLATLHYTDSVDNNKILGQHLLWLP